MFVTLNKPSCVTYCSEMNNADDSNDEKANDDRCNGDI